MNNEEVNSLFKDLKLDFQSYWKYTFTFRGELNGFIVECSYGGSSEDIYRYGFNVKDEPFNNIHEWSYVSIGKDGKQVFEFYND